MELNEWKLPRNIFWSYLFTYFRNWGFYVLRYWKDFSECPNQYLNIWVLSLGTTENSLVFFIVSHQMSTYIYEILPWISSMLKSLSSPYMKFSNPSVISTALDWACSTKSFIYSLTRCPSKVMDFLDICTVIAVDFCSKQWEDKETEYSDSTLKELFSSPCFCS